MHGRVGVCRGADHSHLDEQVIVNCSSEDHIDKVVVDSPKARLGIVGPRELTQAERDAWALVLEGEVSPRPAGRYAPATSSPGTCGVAGGMTPTSVPVWSTSPMLGGLFMASAVAIGASAVSLTSVVAGWDTRGEHAVLEAGHGATLGGEVRAVDDDVTLRH